jgi:hypothetical protein
VFEVMTVLTVGVRAVGVMVVEKVAVEMVVVRGVVRAVVARAAAKAVGVRAAKRVGMVSLAVRVPRSPLVLTARRTARRWSSRCPLVRRYPHGPNLPTL